MTKYVIKYKAEDRYWKDIYCDNDGELCCSWGKHPEDGTRLKNIRNAMNALKAIIEIERTWYGNRTIDDFVFEEVDYD